MRTLATFLALVLLTGVATAANPEPVISATGKTNGTNTVIFSFELSNNGTIPATGSPVASLTIDGTAIQATDISTTVNPTTGVVTVTARGAAVPILSKVKVKLKANLDGGGTTGTTETEVFFKRSLMGTGGEEEVEVPGEG